LIAPALLTAVFFEKVQLVTVRLPLVSLLIAPCLPLLFRVKMQLATVRFPPSAAPPSIPFAIPAPFDASEVVFPFVMVNPSMTAVPVLVI
jgi:hypothetical protein